MTADHDRVDDDHVNPNIGAVPNTAARGHRWAVMTDVTNVLRGFFMGAADTVPGVSGGTVALILGHYERLVTAISRVDRRLVTMVFRRRLLAAWRYLDARFLIALLVGILLGIVTLAGLMHWLLEYRMPETFAVFFGLILASVVIVRRYIERWTPICWPMCVLGIVAAVVIGRLTPHNGSEFSLGYLFLSASVAICAMILPGISGAFVLLLFGVYHSITGMIKDTAKGNVDLSSLVQLGVFAMGCLFGLLAFSRVLKWLLEHYKNATLATLVGLMLGSVDKLWPLQVPTPETAALKMKERVMVRMSPAEWDGNLWLLAGLAISAAAAVLLMERIANHKPPIDFETAD